MWPPLPSSAPTSPSTQGVQGSDARHPRCTGRALSDPLVFLILGQRVVVSCGDERIRRLIAANHAASLVPAGVGDVGAIEYRLDAEGPGGTFRLSTADAGTVTVPHLADLLFHFEKSLVVALQQRRSDLLFLHAAALERAGRAYLLVGESGHGKSTLTWALTHHGFRYLSDELSPIDLGTMSVGSYPRSLCLKQPPPRPYLLPETAVLDLGATLHVPVAELRAGAACGPCPLAAAVIVRYRQDLQEPLLRRIGSAEAAARLYVSTLNALAHPGQGLDAVLRVATGVPCYALESADLPRTCEFVAALEAGLTAAAASPPALV